MTGTLADFYKEYCQTWERILELEEEKKESLKKAEKEFGSMTDQEKIDFLKCNVINQEKLSKQYQNLTETWEKCAKKIALDKKARLEFLKFEYIEKIKNESGKVD